MAAEILVLKHIDIEGPGTLGEFFKETAWGLRVIDLGKNGFCPEDLTRVAAVISLGGPMNVYEEGKYPFLKDAIKEEIPILGICLGAQLLAKACGAKIKRAKTKEIGWNKVNLTDEGKRDPLFENMPAQLSVFQWHEDTFDIPEGGVHLAKSSSCLNQAFRFGRNAYGLQFHLEVTPEMVERWINKYVKKDCVEFDAKDMVIESYKRKEAFRKQANTVYLNFARIIATSQKIGVY